ncbi:hypothetical protein KUTeg_014274 [Tegillarca granosa]|uniref:Splicing factor 3A subunit 1 n=1 Tax=Tegillarca granosa TaxID=220873 RepID=A0ABQ9EZV3_TEGGR|nr:hypothetical protein KUTeg_014274 [Tegillarca granosa]
MPAVEIAVPVAPDEKSEEEISAAKPVIGIIYPPPEVRNIVDKTAGFVARNGPEFESRIRQNEVNNPKFNFLNPADPYHAYYQHKVKEFKEGKGLEPIAPKNQSLVQSQKLLQEQAKIIEEPIQPKDPPPEFEFVADPPSISALDLDVVKLTAQFVARNGRQFLTNLMNREQRNYQFDFLRPQHSLFNYFTKLVEQYTKILIPPKDLLGKLKKESDDYHEVLGHAKYRVEWAKFQEREKRKEEEAVERERIAYASIDWHDFVVVETVDFQPNEQGNLPPPTTPEEVGARVLAQERIDRGEDMEEESDEEDEDEEEEEEMRQTKVTEDMEVDDMEEESSESEDEVERRQAEKERQREKIPQPPQPPIPPPPPPPSEIPQPPLPPAPDKVVVRKDYNPKAAKTAVPENPSDQFMVSPITGEKIPAHKVQEHMRIERNRALSEKREQEDVFASSASIESSLKQLAERRTDIFGVGVEETQIGKKPPPPASVATSMAPKPPVVKPPPPPNPAPLMGQPPRPGLMVLPPRPPMQVMGLRPQMHQPMMPRPPAPPNFPPSLIPDRQPHPPAPPPKPLMDDEPPSKKQKTEEQLIPEEEFLKRHKISVMKAKLNESLGIPAGKQKLQYEGLFMKDSNTLAYYNFLQGATVQLQLKERGGRKK